MKLTKKDHNKEITIKALPNCLDHGVIIVGIYIHRERSRIFEFIVGDRLHVFCRDEWEKINKT